MANNSTRWAAVGALLLGALTPTAARGQDPKPDDPAHKEARPEVVSKRKPAAPDAGDTETEQATDAEVATDEEAYVPEPVAEHHVVAVEAGQVIVDLTADDAELGDVVEVWRSLRVMHPVTGKILQESTLLGKLRLIRVGEQMSFATPIGELVELLPGDSVRRASAASEDVAEPATEPSEGTDHEVVAVEALWASLRGASLKKRILTYEAFVTRYPKSRYSVPLWEEAQTLRELVGKRVEGDMPAAPPRPDGAAVRVDSVGSGNDAPTVDFDQLDERYEKLKKLRLLETGGARDLTPTIAEEEKNHRGVHLHDGGFIRFGFGPQWFNGSLDGGFRSSAGAASIPAQVDVSGLGLTAEFLGGGAPVPGFVLAARLAITVALEPDAELSELGLDQSDTTLDDAVIPFWGVAVDVYPDPELGIHFFGNVGVTMADIGGDDSVGDQQFVGVGYGGGVGFEGWIAEQWSLGIQARLDAAYMVGEETSATTSGDPDTFTLVNPTVQMAFTFN